ncbi:MAG: response regulator [Lachnospiraceae bacterium]|nr:response regulator [Lachnospiraceae bacterium]
MYRVMIVDDEQVVCQGMQRLIDWGSYGFQVVRTASDGQEALELQLQEHFDLIVTDLKMPRMDGVELVRQLAERQENCKVIIVSAYGEFSYAQAVMEYGVQYYLLKPINEVVLCGYLSRIAEQLSANGETEQAEGEEDFAEEAEQTGAACKQFEHLYRLSANGVITELLGYINDHYSEPLTLNLLAKLYSFSPVYLGRLFKKETGLSFNEYLNSYRIRAAVEYIDGGHDMIYEIAERVGYRDINYFYKCFKALVGTTPGEYRNRFNQ